MSALPFVLHPEYSNFKMLYPHCYSDYLEKFQLDSGVHIFRPPKIEIRDYEDAIAEGRRQTHDKCSLSRMLREIQEFQDKISIPTIMELQQRLLLIEKAMGGRKEAYANLIMTKDFITEILKFIVLGDDYGENEDDSKKVFYNQKRNVKCCHGGTLPDIVLTHEYNGRPVKNFVIKI